MFEIKSKEDKKNKMFSWGFFTKKNDDNNELAEEEKSEKPSSAPSSAAETMEKTLLAEEPEEAEEEIDPDLNLSKKKINNFYTTEFKAGNSSASSGSSANAGDLAQTETSALSAENTITGGNALDFE